MSKWNELIIKQMNEVIKQCRTYISYYIVILIIFIICVYLSFDPLALTTRGFMYLFIILIPIFYLLFGIYVKYYLDGTNTNPFYIVSLFLLFIFIGTIYFYSKMNSTNILLFSYLVAFIFILIILVGFVIFYNVFFEYLNKQPGNLGHFIQFVFYIPCLFNDLIKYLLEQYHITPNIVFILFIFEVLLILLYIYLPKMFNSLFKQSTNELLMKPVYLNTQTTIGVTTKSTGDGGTISITNKLPPIHTIHKMFPITHPTTVPEYRNNNYGVSMWIYVNENITSNDEIEIIKFCGGKPRITYLNNRTNNNSYFVYFTDNTTTGSSENNRYKLYLNNQKWNYFAFSYYLNNVDLFINGKLERTFTFTNNFPFTITNADNIIIGQDNGLNGAICNILYYTSPLTKFQVANSYNLLSNQNPPINIL